MNLKITLLSALLISVSTSTINAMDTQQKQDQLVDLRARILKLSLDINDLSYRNAQTISQNPSRAFNITNHNTLTSIAKSSIDIATLTYKINNRYTNNPAHASAKETDRINSIPLQAQQLQLITMLIAATDVTTQFAINNNMFNSNKN